MEKNIFQDIEELIGKSNPVIIEIGSYDGGDTRKMLDVFPNANIHCIEADPRSVSLFHEQFGEDERVLLTQAAVCNKSGLTDLWLSDSKTRRHYVKQDSWSASSSIRKPVAHLELFKDVTFNEKIRVSCIQLDRLYSEGYRMGGPDIDFIWMDVNGAEEDVILGGSQLMEHKTRFIYTEFSDKELYEGQITLEKILELLPSFEQVNVYNYFGNFGNVLLRNRNL